jgi:1-acyl-sn-glycerol-3-phosphate acyltransferase
VVFSLVTAAWGVACHICSFFPGGEDRAHRYLRHWARLSLRFAGIRITVAGREHLDLRKAYVFMANHTSFLDILLILACIPYNFRMIVKQEVFSLPFLGLAVRSSGQIPLDRDNPRKGLRSIKQAADLLRKGVSIVVFPEGTRSRDGRVQEFKSTLFVLPIRTQTPVVPVLIEGAFQALRRGSMLLNRGPMNVTFLKPIAVESFTDKDRAVCAEKVRQSLIGCEKVDAPEMTRATG